MKNSVLIRIMAFLAVAIVISGPTCQESFSQKPKHGLEYTFNPIKYCRPDTVTWYGWDFSNLKICDHNAFAYMVKQEYIPVWLTVLGEHVSADRVRRNLMRPHFNQDLVVIEDLYKEKEVNSFISTDYYEISLDTLEKIVKTYKLNEKSGLGFVIIVETMNKPERFVSAYLTFFDIASRELVFTTKMWGLPGGKWGVELFYRNGLLELYDYFMKRYYLLYYDQCEKLEKEWKKRSN